MVAVFESSAWIFIAKLGIAEQAVSLFDKTIVPNAVHEEIAVRNDEASTALAAMLSENRVEIMPARNRRFVNALHRRLGKGESESIVVSLDTNADVVILDDHAARTLAICHLPIYQQQLEIVPFSSGSSKTGRRVFRL